MWSESLNAMVARGVTVGQAALGREHRGGVMDAQRFDALARALRPANRRSLLGGAIAGVLGIASLVHGQDESSAARRHNRNNNSNRRRRRRRRSRGRTWNFTASLSHLNETPPSSGDRFATSASNAKISITQRRRRNQICGTFNYSTTAVANRNINVRDVILQVGNTRNNTQPELSFSGWFGKNVSDRECQNIGRNQANFIRRNAANIYVNVRTATPNHPNGAVAGLLVRQ